MKAQRKWPPTDAELASVHWPGPQCARLQKRLRRCHSLKIDRIKDLKAELAEGYLRYRGIFS